MKNTFTRILLFAFLLIAATACEKVEDLNKTIVEGQVIDATTNQAIPFAGVELYGMYMQASFPAFDSYIIGGKADADGKFRLSFEAEQDYNYALFGVRNNFVQKYYTVEEVLIQDGDKNRNLKLRLQPYAWVKVNLINEPPKQYSELRWKQYHNPMLLETRIVDDFPWYLQIDANKPVDIEYWLEINGGPLTHFSKTVTVTAFDTLEMEVRY